MNSSFEDLEFELLALHYLNECVGIKLIEKYCNEYKSNEVRPIYIYQIIALILKFL